MEHPPGTIGSRLLHLQRLAGVSSRELDRVAGRNEGHLSVILHRLRKNPTASIDADTASDYCAATGVRIEWLTRGEGPEPTRRSVRAAMARTKSKHDADGAATGTDGR
jgi:hypothetical protein